MGYTHYWTQTRDFDVAEWQQITGHIGRILATAIGNGNIRIANGNGDAGTKAKFADDFVAFNGSGAMSHEGFVLNRIREPLDRGQPALGWDFCKTDRKPYDTAVTAVLCYLSTVASSHDVSSDGSGQDFIAGLGLARQSLPELADQLDIPMPIMRKDRWCPPRPSVHSETFTFNLCVDGHAYVERYDGRAGYRFRSHSEAVRFAVAQGDLFTRSGYLDPHRQRHLALRQDRVLAVLIEAGHAEPADLGRALPPPDFIRPEDIPAAEPIYTFEAFLARAGEG